MLKRIFVLFLSVLIIVTFSSCNKKDRELYQGEQTAYIQCSNGLVLDVSTMVKYPYTAKYFPVDPYPTPTFDALEDVRNEENGVILLVTLEEYPIYVANANENKEWDFTLETRFQVKEIFYGDSSSVREEETLLMKTHHVNFITTEHYNGGDRIVASLAHMTEGVLDVSEQISWTMEFSYTRHIYEDGSPVKKTVTFLRKGYSYIVYGTVDNGEFHVNTRYSIIEVATAEDHAKFYENLGLEDPEFAEISAQVLEKYWYN